MKNFYFEPRPGELYPIFGAASLAEAVAMAGGHSAYVIESSEHVLMNPATGSLGFANDWYPLGTDDGLIAVYFDSFDETWLAL